MRLLPHINGSEEPLSMETIILGVFCRARGLRYHHTVGVLISNSQLNRSETNKHIYAVILTRLVHQNGHVVGSKIPSMKVKRRDYKKRAAPQRGPAVSSPWVS